MNGKWFDEVKTWIPEKDIQKLKEIAEDLQTQLFWGAKPVEKKPEDNVKLAWVIIKGEKQMIGVDNKTMEGFEMQEKTPEIKLPLIPLKYDSFVRWCTSFDL